MLRNIFILYRKEVLNIFKNVEAIVLMIMVPLVLYPLVILMNGELVTQTIKKKTSAEIDLKFLQISPDNQEGSNEFKVIFNYIQNELGKKSGLAENKKFKLHFNIKPIQIIKNTPTKTLDEEIQLVFFTSDKKYTKGELQLYYNGENDLAFLAKNYINDLLENFKYEMMIQNLKENKIPIEILNPIIIRNEQNMAPPQHTVKKYGSTVFAILLILLTYVSCQYVATEVLPVEREQMTLETLISAPITWSEIIISKFLAVLSAGLLNASFNLISIFTFGGSILASITNFSGEEIHINISIMRIIIVILIMIPLALMAASLSFLFISFAKTRLSASYFSVPGLILVIGPASLSLLPNVKLEGAWLFLPFANMSLVIRNLLTENVPLITLLLVIISSVLFSGILIALSIAISNQKDKILSGNSQTNIFSRYQKSKTSLNTAEAIFIFLFSIGLYFSIGTYISSYKMIYNLNFALPFLVAMFLPSYVYLKSKNIQISSAIGFKKPTLNQIIGACLFVVPMLLTAQIVAHIASYFIPELNQDKSMQELILKIISEQPFWIVLVLFGLTPGVFEEFLMRGILFQGLKKSLQPWVAIFITGFIFAILHGFLRSIPILPIGILLTFLMYKTDNIILPMIAHTLFNSTSCIFAIIIQDHEIKKSQMMPIPLLIGLIILMIGISIISFILVFPKPTNQAILEKNEI